MSERICTVCSTAIADVDRLRSALTASESRAKELNDRLNNALLLRDEQDVRAQAAESRARAAEEAARNLSTKVNDQDELLTQKDERIKALEIERNLVPVIDGHSGRQEELTEAMRILQREGTWLSINRELLAVIVRMAQSAWGSWTKVRDSEDRIKALEQEKARALEVARAWGSWTKDRDTAQIAALTEENRALRAALENGKAAAIELANRLYKGTTALSECLADIERHFAVAPRSSHLAAAEQKERVVEAAFRWERAYMATDGSYKKNEGEAAAARQGLQDTLIGIRALRSAREESE